MATEDKGVKEGLMEGYRVFENSAQVITGKNEYPKYTIGKDTNFYIQKKISFHGKNLI